MLPPRACTGRQYYRNTPAWNQVRRALPYILPQERLAVFFSPKVAGTSVRAFMFEVENGFPLRAYTVQGAGGDLTALANRLVINNRFRLVDHKEISGFERIAIVRDPVRRILSAYSNRVLHYRELSRDAVGPALDAANLSPDLDLGVLMSRLGAYMQCSKSIARHFSHQETFLGKSREYFHRIFRVEALHEFVDYINGRCGTSATMPRLQDGGPKLDLASLPGPTQRAVLDYARKSLVFDWVPEYRNLYADEMGEV
ncbi:MAG: sulfotransferase family 2 domain-containing protein [Alphaproteobacteria bacterium]